MNVQPKRWVTKVQFTTIKQIINKNKMAALLVCTCFGSFLLKSFFSLFLTSALTHLAMSSPMELNASSVTGIPNNATKMHKIRPVVVWGVM